MRGWLPTAAGSSQSSGRGRRATERVSVHPRRCRKSREGECRARDGGRGEGALPLGTAGDREQGNTDAKLEKQSYYWFAISRRGYRSSLVNLPERPQAIERRRVFLRFEMHQFGLWKGVREVLPRRTAASFSVPVLRKPLLSGVQVPGQRTHFPVDERLFHAAVKYLPILRKQGLSVGPGADTCRNRIAELLGHSVESDELRSLNSIPGRFSPRLERSAGFPRRLSPDSTKTGWSFWLAPR